MITKKVKLVLVGCLDLIYINIPYTDNATTMRPHCDQNRFKVAKVY